MRETTNKQDSQVEPSELIRWLQEANAIPGKSPIAVAILVWSQAIRLRRRDHVTITPRAIQLIAYAKSKGCRRAALVYPMDTGDVLNEEIGDLKLRSFAYPLEGDLENAGRAFRNELLEWID